MYLKTNMGSRKVSEQRHEFVRHNHIISKAPHWLVNLVGSGESVGLIENFEITSLDILISTEKEVQN